MKNSIKNFAVVVLIALVTFSFTTINKEEKELKIKKSSVVWKGYKVTGSHTGTIALESGSLLFRL